jgi:hypothetical protein
MWQGNSGPSAAARLPPKLQFKRLMETTGPAPHQTMIDTLLSMGFTQEQAESATRATNGRSVEDAAAFLLTGACAPGHTAAPPPPHARTHAWCVVATWSPCQAALITPCWCRCAGSATRQRRGGR